jgi:hypothetical protein
LISILLDPVADLYSPTPETVKEPHVELPADLLKGCLSLIHIAAIFPGAI